MRAILTSTAVLAALGQLATQAQMAIIGVDVSPTTGWSLCKVANDGVTSVSAPPYPLNITSGIGWLINPAPAPGGPDGFVLHGAGIVTVTYHFNQPVTVDQLEVIEHFNGISKLEGFVGNDLSSLVSIGDIYSNAGDVNTPAGFVDNTSYVFDFNNTTPGTYFRFVSTENVLGAFAVYGAFPRTADGARLLGAVVPEPHEYAVLAGLGLVGFAVWRRRGAR